MSKIRCRKEYNITLATKEKNKSTNQSRKTQLFEEKEANEKLNIPGTTEHSNLHLESEADENENDPIEECLHKPSTVDVRNAIETILNFSLFIESEVFRCEKKRKRKRKKKSLFLLLKCLK